MWVQATHASTQTHTYVNYVYVKLWFQTQLVLTDKMKRKIRMIDLILPKWINSAKHKNNININKNKELENIY